MKRVSERKKDLILLLICAFIVVACAKFDAATRGDECGVNYECER